jgi:hypothetical protein
VRGFHSQVRLRPTGRFSISFRILYTFYQPVYVMGTLEGRPRRRSQTHIPMNASSLTSALFAVGFPMMEFFASFSADSVR